MHKYLTARSLVNREGKTERERGKKEGGERERVRGRARELGREREREREIERGEEAKTPRSLFQVSGCQKLLVLSGPTYAHRLWCVMEIFCFLTLGNNTTNIVVLQLDSRTPGTGGGYPDTDMYIEIEIEIEIYWRSSAS